MAEETSLEWWETESVPLGHSTVLPVFKICQKTNIESQNEHILAILLGFWSVVETDLQM